MPAPNRDLAERLAHDLEPWFERSQRDLAWRRTRDPYAIWVSEIMLQQTRVETVSRYYEAFLRRFPDVGSLAAADESDVLEAWSGLGYYRRARLLWKGAGYVARELDGVVPSEPDALRSIPGVGAYTAGAISSIAFDRPSALVDGNVARVLSRIRALEDPVEQDAKSRGHWELVAEILQHGSPRALAQALMELGATVCTPRSPTCAGCPVAEHCAARKSDRADTIPAPKVKKASPQDDVWAVAAYRGDRLVMVRRPAEGLLAGMWCLPLVPRTPRSRRPSADALREALGVEVEDIEVPAGGDVKHVFTHRVWKLRPVICRVGAPVPTREGAWIEVAEVRGGGVPKGGVPSVTRKVLEKLKTD